MPHIKYFQDIADLHGDLVKALGHVKALQSIKSNQTVDALTEELRSKKNKTKDERRFLVAMMIGSIHFEKFFPNECDSPIAEITNEQAVSIFEWEKASAYLLAAQMGFSYKGHKRLEKPSNQVFIDLFTAYKYFLEKNHFFLKCPKDTSHYDYIRKDYKKKVGMCNTYIQRFTDNTDWVQRLLLPEYVDLDTEHSQ